MASKKVLLDIYKSNCLLYKEECHDKIFAIWLKILGQDDYPDTLVKDAFEHYCENSPYKAMSIAHFNEYRSRYYYKYRELDKFNRDW